MLPRSTLIVAAVLAVALAAPLHAANLDSLKAGTPDLKMAGALAFGPEGILFVGDPVGAAIFAFDTGDRPASPATGALKADKIDARVAALLGTTAKDVRINDLAVNPISGAAYLSVSRGQGTDSKPVILRVDRKGDVKEMPLANAKFSKAGIPNANEKQRTEAITGLAYVDGKVFVAGLSNEQFASNLRAIPFPFTAADKGTSVEIYHGAHGAFETRSPVRTFMPLDIKGEMHLLAAYTCTPLVKFPIKDLKPGEKLRGTTVAELGNRNRPLDMIQYQKGGKEYVLIANSARGIMKVTTENIDKIAGITSRISDKAGLTYDTIKEWQGIEQLAKLDKDHALVLMRTDGSLNLETLPLP